MRKWGLVAALSILFAIGDTGAAHGQLRYAVGLEAGGTWLDPTLANYRWDISGNASYGLELRAGIDRTHLGLRLWRSGTTQGTGIPGETTEPKVRLTGVELVGRLRVANFWGFRSFLSAGGGLLHMGYSPDELSIVPQGASEAILVRFQSIDEWTMSYGFAVERNLFGMVALGLHLERLTFSLDTLHRNGGNIEEQRERFGNWIGRLTLTRSFGGA